MIQLDRKQLTSQKPCYVQITGMLRTSRPEIRVIGSYKKNVNFMIINSIRRLYLNLLRVRILFEIQR